ncbi:aldehyde ferredoxin oxidoreductase [Desulfosarcina widdelii]|uniref:Aldehyde ferredoxin oxidoreductase n=1 Tax=Desulfosarcina widdelii TaxID=947919 RepID=A0A5K7Z2E8_9BACT|nr:aldehyde ferredoxin oxidoreductase family protein [Desulfosarcina widdelii]BBO72664.1 aldehyde ferredoxin oxidoreductase [Desulfosarcina widdelii]
MLKNGFMGKILRVNLTDETIEDESLKSSVMKQYIGGRGLGAYLAYKEIPPHEDAFSPNISIYFITGPLQGTLTPFTPKFIILNKSPLSGSLSRSVCGGSTFGAELKYAGYDAVVVKGKAKTPVYLLIDNGKVSIKDAQKYWGMTSSDTQEAIKTELNDPTVSIVPIGPAGEKRVRFSGVIVGSRAAGRGGAGAVMGSKNLKAIVVRGNKSVHVADIKQFKKLLGETYTAIKENPDVSKRIEFGTPGTLASTYSSGILPTMNFSRSTFDGIEGLMPENVRDMLYVHNESCFGCPLPCGKLALIKKGPFKGMVLPGPEYETIGLLGSNCGIGDIQTVAQANYLCNEYGLDTISTGSVIAFAIECYQKGIITKKDTDGLELKFGDTETLISLIEKISRRDGFGNVLAEGTKRASKMIGQGSDKFAMHSKGQDFAAYEPRALVGMGLLYATATPGANHSFGPTLTAEKMELKDTLTNVKKGKIVRREQNRYCLQDSMVMCSFSRFGMNDSHRLRFVNAVTGWNFSDEEAILIADRIFTLEKLFNIREGFSKADDNLPWRCLNEPLPDGLAKGNTVPLESMLQDYYADRGWNRDTGIPGKEMIERLGLSDLVCEN